MATHRPHFTMTADDRKEITEAIITRFRLGEIGPMTLRRDLAEHGVSESDIDAFRDLYIDECAKNMRA